MIKMRSEHFELSGSGIKRAVQEAVKAKKQVVFVYDYDSLGRILKIGYALLDEKEKSKEIPYERINWFNEGEVQIVRKQNLGKDSRAADLKIEYTLPSDHDKKERQFLLELPLGKSKDAMLRNIFRLRGNIIKSFVVQAEIRIKEDDKQTWNPIVRYDCAHGFIHRDLIHRDGKKTKERLTTQNLKDATRIAIEEMKNNLKLWVVKLGYEAKVPEIFGKITVNAELDAAREYLLRLIEHPEIITQTPSTFIQVKDAADYIKRIFPP